jgi:signal transduction histidine kinase/streptogramin lyase
VLFESPKIRLDAVIQLPSSHAGPVASGVGVVARAVIALLFGSAAAGAGSPVFTSYTSHDGLAHDRVLRIVRDSRGFLWFCTGEGLSRFDGQRFRTFGVAEGLPAAFVSDLLESRDGSYWVATDRGVARFRPEAPVGPRPFTVVGVGADPPSSRVNRLAQGAGGELWAATSGGLFRLEGDDGRFLPVPLGLPGVPDRAVRVWALAPAPDGMVWVGHDHGLSRVSGAGAALEHFTIQPTPAGDNVWDLRLDRGGRLWIAHERTITAAVPSTSGPGGSPRPPWTRLREGRDAVQADGSLRVPREHGEAVRYGPAQGLITVAAGALLEAADGTLWIGNKGLSAFDGRRIRSYTAAHGLPDSAVISLAEDRDGAIWVGTRARGAVKLSKYDIESRSLSNAPGDEGVTSFFEDAAGAVYAVSPAGRLRRFDRQGRMASLELPVPRALRAPVPLARPEVLRGRDGGWWIATAAGLVRVAAMPADRLARASPLAVYTTRHGLGSDAIGLLHEDREDNVWIGHSREAARPLSRWSPATGAFLAYGADEGLPAHDTVTAIVEDGTGRLFVALAEGVVARRDAERFTALAGLDPAVTGGVLDLLFDSEGRLWIATARSGLRRVSDPAGPAPRIDAFTAAEGLASDAVRALVDDRFGRVYALTSRGIDCLDARELRRLRRFTTAHGVRNYFFQAAFRDSRGVLWLGSREGLTRLVPERWEPLPPPLALVEELQVSGVRVPVSEVGQREVGPLRLDYHQNSFQIDFLALDFGGDATRFRHRLDGLDGEWSAPSLDHTVHYGRLAPGDYRFRVKADAADATEAEVRFRIEPPLWAKAWFRAAAVLAGIALAAAAYRAHVSRLLALERVRARIAADLHDDLGATVSRMAVLSEVARRQVASAPREAVRLLEEIGASARALLDTTTDIVWAIDPRRDDAASLVARVREFGAGLLEPKGIAWEFHASPEAEALRLDPEQRRQLLLIFKESLHNIARHARCAAAAVSISTRDGRLRAEIRDDGCGFEADPAETGHGLVSMRARAVRLGGELRIDSRPGEGTRLVLDVPLRRRGA